MTKIRTPDPACFLGWISFLSSDLLEVMASPKMEAVMLGLVPEQHLSQRALLMGDELPAPRQPPESSGNQTPYLQMIRTCIFPG